MPTEIRQTSGVLMWTAVWTVLSFGPLSCAQQSLERGYTPSSTEVAAILECERTVLGEMGPDKRLRTKLIYDYRYGRYGIADARGEEIVGCLVDKYGWIGMSAPNGRRVVAQPPR